VSPDGLMATNHHVGLSCIQNVSSAETDYVKSGFYAATRGEEAACPGYEVRGARPRPVTAAVACELRGGPGSHAGRPGTVGGPAP
jgi:hypothetical protein